jgi:hypothetical protein
MPREMHAASRKEDQRAAINEGSPCTSAPHSSICKLVNLSCPTNPVQSMRTATLRKMKKIKIKQIPEGYI